MGKSMTLDCDFEIDLLPPVLVSRIWVTEIKLDWLYFRDLAEFVLF